MKQSLLVLTALFGAQLLSNAVEPGKSNLLPGEARGDSEAHIDYILLTTGAKPLTLNIWPGKAPGEIKELPPEADTTKPDGRLVTDRHVIRLGNVSTPQITIFKPDPAIDTGTSVIIAPGGAYNILAYDLEGTEVAEWLNTIGVTGIVLKYRVPKRNPEIRWKAAVQDAQRAMSLVRGRSDEFGVDPEKIGLMGFSAGAQTAGLTALLQARQYPPVDGYDQHSFKPNFVGIIYLGYSIHEEPDVSIEKGLPPFFMAVAYDDKDRSISSAELYIELKKADVPAELHIYESGGHGYGLRSTEQPVTRWNNVMADWMKQIGMLD
ncbi:MAG: alpha/beta hydrolase [Verrucomicrobia bacterium]|nr:alpha/beta hydrolase [Verrucomicrobiota bacterium]